MGFVRGPLKLTFADDDFAGLEVLCKRTSIGRLMAVRSLAQQPGTEGVDELVKTLADAIIAWNVEDEVYDEQGNVIDVVPVRPDEEGVASRDHEMLFAILNAWMDAASGVSPPLSTTSNSGEPSPVEFDLTAALSQSQPSSPTPDSSTDSSADTPATP